MNKQEKINKTNKLNKNKISKKLKNHDSIVKAIATFNCKEVITLEDGNYFYWIRLYKNGKETYLKNNYFTLWDCAVSFYDKQIEDLKNQGYNFKFNEVK